MIGCRCKEGRLRERKEQVGFFIAKISRFVFFCFWPGGRKRVDPAIHLYLSDKEGGGSYRGERFDSNQKGSRCVSEQKGRIWPMEISRKRRKIISGAIQRTTRMLKFSWRMFGLSHGSQQNDRIWRQFFAVLLIEVQLDSGETTVSCQWFIYLCLPLSTGN